MATAPLDNSEDPEPADLVALLRGSGSSLDSSDLTELLKGVAAAPGLDGGNGPPDDWIRMVTANPTDELRHHLANMLSTLQLNPDDGLTPPCPSAERLAALRAELASRELDGFVVPLADEHQGEYIPKRAQRLAWLTGFTGSAGTAVVLADKAAIFVDGRYTLQASNQVDAEQFEIVPLADTSPSAWISANLKSEGKLGYDPWLHTSDGFRRLELACKQKKAALIDASPNPIDVLWTNQPAHPLSPMALQSEPFAGESSLDKRQRLAKVLTDSGQDAVVLTAPDSIAWLANIRGGDVPYTPFCLMFAILYADDALKLFIDPRKVTSDVAGAFGDGITHAPPTELGNAITQLGTDKATVRLDLANAAHAIRLDLIKAGALVVNGEDPCSTPKARKNQVELDGVRAAHLRDGVALTRFLAWIAEHGASGQVTEISAADRLEALRREGDRLRGLSFPTISGAGPNGAIVHYRVTEESNRTLEPGSLYLVDSGAQYLDGTTDVTRTIAIGEPSTEMRDRFTRVLKGHIALATAKFPAGTSGSQLDILARNALWQAGLDYDHGTGHGVGSYLGVHEGPQRISKMPNTVSLEPGMVVSNEPGYYKTGEYGIRIENLVAVIAADKSVDAEKEMLAFETLTLAPIDVNLVDRSMLSESEIDWLNAYHDRVHSVISPWLDSPTASWLIGVTAKF